MIGPIGPGRIGAAFLALGLVASIAAGAAMAAEEPAKVLFGAAPGPSEEVPAPIGSYARGCLAGGTVLPETGPGWQAMRLSRNRNWGHPKAIDFIERLSADAQRAGWPRLYIGDISQPRGGPMLTGHRSHQIGLDIDIWLRAPSDRELSRDERERISSVNVVRADRKGVNESWSEAHHAIIRAAASDPDVARIFVNAAIKKALCDGEPSGTNRDWLQRVRPWWGHDSHFHVRLNCPAEAAGCVEQDPIPPGDGCDASLDWWFSDEALNPKPTGTPTRPREITLADLPAACQQVLAR